ncbi:MAG: rod shape-determining protein MreC [Deltaproteobacteria bacterium]|nr:rod shape-determining protein MreC [Deltaproteobacteria bacterium]
MLELIKRNRILVSVIFTLLLLLIVLSVRLKSPGFARWTDEVFQIAAYPFQASYHKISSSLDGMFSNYVYLVDLKQENERLRSQVEALQEELNHYTNSAVQFDLLREQLNFLEERPEKKVFAEVIGESVDNLHHVLLINRGGTSGIKRNFPVVLRQGVVGRIQSVTATQSVVQLIIDRRHRFPVLVQRSRDRMVMQGEGGNVRLQSQNRGIAFGQDDGLRLSRIRMLADVEPEDKVITSGLGGIFPKGLMVGTVKRVSRERHELFQSAEVEPAVDFNRIEGVFVIIKDPKDTEFPLFFEE